MTGPMIFGWRDNEDGKVVLFLDGIWSMFIIDTQYSCVWVTALRCQLYSMSSITFQRINDTVLHSVITTKVYTRLLETM
jgi:hypothetical protein